MAVAVFPYLCIFSIVALTQREYRIQRRRMVFRQKCLANSILCSVIIVAAGESKQSRIVYFRCAIVFSLERTPTTLLFRIKCVFIQQLNSYLSMWNYTNRIVVITELPRSCLKVQRIIIDFCQCHRVSVSAAEWEYREIIQATRNN